jgi:SNF2 family DNA or RNA helicase
MKSVDCLILDESQKIKNNQSSRANLCFRLYKDTQFITWISGTPGQNPLELAYLLPILRYKTEGIKTGECTAEELERWAAKQKLKLKRGAYGKWEWDQEGNEDKILADILFNSKTKPRVAIHRVPSDIIGWPEVQRILHPFELDDEEETQYKRSWEELRAAVLNTPVAARSKAQSMAMVALIRFRQKASLIRVPKTVDLAEDILENGHQVAISCEFLDTIRAFEEALLKLKITTTTVTGAQQDPVLRQKAIDRFNKGEAQVILFTVTEGINLQENVILAKDKPRTQIDHDIRWSGLAMSQVDARCHRNGKYARVYWTYAKDTVEEDVIQRVLLRLKGIENIVGDDRQLAKEIEDQLLARAAK